MNEFVTLIIQNLIEIVFAIISLIVVGSVVPFINKHAIPWLKEKHLYSLVTKAVQAAEKLAENSELDKKEWVINALEKNGVEVDDTVEMFIESAVKELDVVLGYIDDALDPEETDE